MNDTAIKFLSGTIPDHLGRYVGEYLKFDHAEMEKCHGWVQWAFPIDTPSKYNPDAPVITVPFIHTAETSFIINSLVKQFMKFIGLNDYYALDHDRFKEAITDPNNHNILRISRVLTHLMISSKSDEARWLLRSITLLMIKRYPERFSPVTVAYWYTLVYDFQISDGFY
jgi:hypothetical protein